LPAELDALVDAEPEDPGYPVDLEPPLDDQGAPAGWLPSGGQPDEELLASGVSDGDGLDCDGLGSAVAVGVGLLCAVLFAAGEADVPVDVDVLGEVLGDAQSVELGWAALVLALLLAVLTSAKADAVWLGVADALAVVVGLAVPVGLPVTVVGLGLPVGVGVAVAVGLPVGVALGEVDGLIVAVGVGVLADVGSGVVAV
jgi:hypothetical protein